MSKYSENPAWADIEPIAQDDTPHPLAAIAYTDEYAEAIGYLRAVMAKNEYSERVLSLTEDIINMNPAHYTVWLYRARTLDELKADLRKEMEWLNPTSLRHLKNYQIWHHRQTIIDRLGSPDGESDFISKMFESDSKNYHVWSYRQWLVKRFDLWDKPEELKWTKDMIEEDVRNNSAWNHRYYLVIGGRGAQADISKDVVEREIEYAKAGIRKAPQNQSPWNYLRGVLRAAKLPVSTIKAFAREFADLSKPDEVRSTHALDVLADVYAEENKNDEAKQALDLLAQKYDPIRRPYWNYRKNVLNTAEAAA